MYVYAVTLIKDVCLYVTDIQDTCFHAVHNKLNELLSAIFTPPASCLLHCSFLRLFTKLRKYINRRQLNRGLYMQTLCSIEDHLLATATNSNNPLCAYRALHALLQCLPYPKASPHLAQLLVDNAPRLLATMPLLPVSGFCDTQGTSSSRTWRKIVLLLLRAVGIVARQPEGRKKIWLIIYLVLFMAN